MKYLVSRHAGAIEWCFRKGYEVDNVISHIDLEQIHSGDIIIGILPLPMVAAIQQKGGRYLHLSVPLNAELRGVEISADTMEQLGAKVEEFYVEKI